ncbi:MAG: hypothetical protein QGH20_05800, partial [Candidatus Latescibacteria bacterium]|nr:hypothetical protein [Candidatus Latescibacterota bacterium]
MSSTYLSGDPLLLDHGPHLFIDDTLIEDRWALPRKVNPPYPSPANPIVVADRPWEERPYRPQVIYDDDLGIYRMYYQCFSGTNYWSSEGPPYYCCYAESSDGFNWNKPERPGAPFLSHKSTNIITVGDDDARVQAPYVFKNPDESDASRLWLMIYNRAGLRLAYSPDGIRWTPAREEQLFCYHSDTSNHVVWNDTIRKWVLYMRPPMFASGRKEGPGARHMRRRVAISTSDDLLEWTVPRTVIYPDELNLPDFDAFHALPYGGQYIGLLTVMDQEAGGTTEIYLASSPDGLSWSQSVIREPWMPRGLSGGFDDGCVNAPCNPIWRGDELLFYYSGFQRPQTVFDQEGAIGLVKLMRDRFVGLEAGKDELGWVLTREFIWKGRRLVINCAAGHGDQQTYGRIHVEVIKRPVDAGAKYMTGEPLEGRTIDDCDLIRSNRP